MSWLMNDGVETAHAFRFFETGKRRTIEQAEFDGIDGDGNILDG